MCTEDNLIFWEENKTHGKETQRRCLYHLFFSFYLYNNTLNRAWTSRVELQQRLKGTGNQWESQLNASFSKRAQESIRDSFLYWISERNRASNPVIDACHQQHIYPFPPLKLKQISPHFTSSQSYSWSPDFKWGMIITLMALAGRTDSRDVGCWQQFNYFRVMMRISVRGRFWHCWLLFAIINMIKHAASQSLLFSPPY